MRCSLSLRERARVRGKATRTRQGLGALSGVELCFPSLRVVDIIGSSQARWFAERFFPLTPALSPRRGRTVRCTVATPERLDSSPRGMRCSLRESERGAKYEIVFTQCFQGCPRSLDLSPLVPRGEREKTNRRVLPAPLSPILRSPP